MAEPVSAGVLRALAHPVRLAALVALEERERTATELAVALDVEPDALAEHLADLAAAGLVREEAGSGRLRTAARGWGDVAERLRRIEDGDGA